MGFCFNGITFLILVIVGGFEIIKKQQKAKVPNNKEHTKDENEREWDEVKRENMRGGQVDPEHSAKTTIDAPKNTK